MNRLKENIEIDKKLIVFERTLGKAMFDGNFEK